MPRFAANLSMLFTEVPLIDQIDQAARAGFRAVEIQFPYEVVAALRERLKLQRGFDGVARICLRATRPAAIEASLRSIRRHEYRDGIARAIDYAQALGVPQFNCLPGKQPTASMKSDALDLCRNIAYAAGEIGRAGLTLLIKPVNVRDVPGFWLQDAPTPLSILDEVGASNFVSSSISITPRDP